MKFFVKLFLSAFLVFSVPFSVGAQDDVVVTKGAAWVDGRKVVESKCARGYLLPAQEFDDVDRTKNQFDRFDDYT